MEKLPVVEAAKALMNEAMTWTVMKWLREKKTVRKTSDQANAALDQLSQAVRERWPKEIRAAYEALPVHQAGTVPRRQALTLPESDLEASLVAAKSRESDDEAYRARMDAEETFDKAEKQLSSSLAREGCRKAIHSWDLHEKAIRKAEAIIPSR
jgi:hypothetical protein